MYHIGDTFYQASPLGDEICCVIAVDSAHVYTLEGLANEINSIPAGIRWTVPSSLFFGEYLGNVYNIPTPKPTGITSLAALQCMTEHQLNVHLNGYYPENTFSGLLYSPPCMHVWKNYIGLNNSFDYCEVCDEKRNA